MSSHRLRKLHTNVSLSDARFRTWLSQRLGSMLSSSEHITDVMGYKYDCFRAPTLKYWNIFLFSLTRLALFASELPHCFESLNSTPHIIILMCWLNVRLNKYLNLLARWFVYTPAMFATWKKLTEDDQQRSKGRLLQADDWFYKCANWKIFVLMKDTQIENLFRTPKSINFNFQFRCGNMPSRFVFRSAQRVGRERNVNFNM